MKIAVIGYSGSGKSTMSRQLGRVYNLPVLHLDTAQFLTDWQERDTEEAQAIVNKFLENNGWVIDGNYRKFYLERRISEADKIVFFNFNRLTCFLQAYERYKAYKGKTRPDMANGCNEKLDYEFIKWLLISGRNKEQRIYFKKIIEKYPQKMIILTNRRQAEEYFNSIINQKVILDSLKER